MYLPKPTEGGDFTPPPAGVFPAICYRFIDLGTQSTTYQGEAKTARKVMLSWEITDTEERMDDGRPFVISQRYTWSMHEKATLRKTLESWRGKSFEEKDFGPGGFDTKKLIGQPCMLALMQTTKDGKTYTNISSVSKLAKNFSPGELVNETVYFSLDDFDPIVLSKLSESLQQTIRSSPEYAALSRGGDHHGYEPPPYEHGDPGFQPDDSHIPF